MTMLRISLLPLVVLAALLLPSAAAAQGEEIRLGLRPIDQPGDFFDVELDPAETLTLGVELVNAGAASIRARTYAADVYTIINGGFAARLRDEPVSGTTLWLDYATDVIEIAAGTTVARSFTIAAPADAAPGEYITALVLENEEPIKGSGGVAIDQVIRQAVAVVVTIPGPRTPGLAIGAVTHKVVAGMSTIAVGVENTGNVRLKPVAEMVLIDPAGAEVTRATIAMDSFYAGDATLVEVPLTTLLPPGPYTVDLSLEDAVQQVRAAVDPLPLMVEQVPLEAAPPLIPSIPEVFEAIGQGRVPAVVVIVVVIGAIMLGVLVGLGILRIRRRGLRRSRRGSA